MSEDEIQKLKVVATMMNKKKQKKNAAQDPRAENSIILEGPISKFVDKHHNLVKRYLVLNRHALFVYKDDLSFKSFPQKPSLIIPLGEVASIN